MYNYVYLHTNEKAYKDKRWSIFMATEAIRLGTEEVKVIKAISEQMNISKGEALKEIFKKALQTLI